MREYSLDLNIYTNDPENEIISIPMNGFAI